MTSDERPIALPACGHDPTWWAPDWEGPLGPVSFVCIVCGPDAAPGQKPTATAPTAESRP